MVDPIRKYSDANDELDKATTKVRILQNIIGDTGRSLNKPYEFIVSNVDVGFPPEVTMSRGIHSLNADNWPTAKQIAEALADLHNKRKFAENIWHSLSDGDKKLVKPLSKM